MIGTLPLLTSIFLMQILGAIVTLLIRSEHPHTRNANSRSVGLFAAAVSLIMSAYLVIQRSEAMVAPQREAWNLASLSPFTINLVADEISLVMLLLSSFLFFVIHLIDDIKPHRHQEYVVGLLLTQAMVTAFWCAHNLLMFYVLFEASLIPVFYMIGIWGGKNRYEASFKFILITALGSFLMLFSLLALNQQYGGLDMRLLKAGMASVSPPVWIWWALMAAFAIKIPMIFVHTWLPRAHVEAPTTTSMILAGIMLKFGGYGMLRCVINLMPEHTQAFAPIIQYLSVFAIVYASLAAYVQQDMKRMVAYSSVAHMGVVTLGLFNLNQLGIEGGFFLMVSHGIVSPALFYMVGLIYRRTTTRDLNEFAGLATVMPITVACSGVFIFALIGFPGTAGFVGEVMTIMSTVEKGWILLLGVASGTVLSATYGLRLLKTIGFGKLRTPSEAEFFPLLAEERVVLYVFVFIIICLGLCPEHLLSFVRPALMSVLQPYVAEGVIL